MNALKSQKSILTAFAIALVIVGLSIFVRIPIAPTANAAPLSVGKPAPNFTARSIDGQRFSLTELKGKPVILFAMFGGCGDCIPVGQTLNRIQADFAAKGVSVIALDILNGESTSTLQRYGDYIKADFPLVSYDQSVVRAYNLTAPEVTYVIDTSGNIADINKGALNYQQYKEELDKII